MSASRERKKRVEQSAAAQPEVKKTKKKLSQGWIFAICMILIFAAVVVGMIIYRHSQTHATVLTAGGHDVEVYEFNYFYRDIAATCDQYKQYLGIDEIPLDEQKIDSSDLSMMGIVGLDSSCLEGKEPVDGKYDMTWAELIADNAKLNAASAYAVYEQANKAGYELTEEEAHSIEDTMSQIKGYADENGMSVDEYVEAVFGRGCDEESYRNYLKVVSIASTYPSSLTYTAEELAARDAENPADFDTVAFYYYSVNGTSVKEELDAEAAEEATEETTEETSEETTEEKELTAEERAELDKKAKEKAENMAKEFDVNGDNVALHADYTREYLESVLYSAEMPEEAIDWLYKDAKDGEVKMYTIEPEKAEGEETETEGENKYVVIKFIDRADYNTQNYLSLTVAHDAEDAELEEGATSSKDKIDMIKAALEAEPTEDRFRALILENLDHDHAEGEEHDHSAEGLSENQTRYGAASASKDLFAWLMLEERKAGDWTMIEMDGQTVFYFYLEEGRPYLEMSIESTLRTEWYEELTDAAVAKCGYDKDAAMDAEISFYAAK
ncbi:MAG: hypothetical protein E7467_01040 [Ruminococcaceae bacterium]|nr:hypothetical protein [Oscillospiraceae bacterium]